MLNPITYTEDVVRDFLRYQPTTYPFADQRLHDQMRRLLSLEETWKSPLLGSRRRAGARRGSRVGRARRGEGAPPVTRVYDFAAAHPREVGARQPGLDIAWREGGRQWG